MEWEFFRPMLGNRVDANDEPNDSNLVDLLFVHLCIAAGGGPDVGTCTRPMSRCRVTEINGARPGNVIQVRTTGRDPYLVGRLVGTARADDQVLALEFFCASGVESPSAFFGPPFIGKRSIELPNLPVAQGWQSYHADLSDLVSASEMSRATQLRIDLGNRPEVRLQVRNILLRPKTENEIRELEHRNQVRRDKLAAADEMREYLNTDFPATIESLDDRRDGQCVSAFVRRMPPTDSFSSSIRRTIR